MPLLHRPHMRGTSSSTQPHSVVSIAAVSFSLLGERGKADSPACRRTLGFMASTSPPPERRWGSQGHLPSHWHAQGTVRVLFIPSILRKLLYHIPALRHRRIMNRGSHPAALGFTLDVSFHALLTPGLGGVHAGRRCLYTSASRCCQLGSAMWETGLNSCSFCPPLVVSDAGEGGTLLAAAPRGCGAESGRESSDFVC